MLARVAAHVHGDVDLDAFDRHHNMDHQHPVEEGIADSATSHSKNSSTGTSSSTLINNSSSGSNSSSSSSHRSSSSIGSERKTEGESRAKRRLSGVAAAQADALQALEVTQHLNSANYLTVPRRSSLFSSRAYDDDDDDDDDDDNDDVNKQVDGAVGLESNSGEASTQGSLSPPIQSPSASSTSVPAHQSNRSQLPAPKPLPKKVESRVAQALRALDKDHGILEACSSIDPWLPTTTDSDRHQQHDNSNECNDKSSESSAVPPAAVAYRFRSQLVARALRDTLLHAQVAAVGAALLEFQDDQVVEQCASAPVRKLLFGNQDGSTWAPPETTAVSSPVTSASPTSPVSGCGNSGGSNSKDVRRLVLHKGNDRRQKISSKPNAHFSTTTKGKSSDGALSGTVGDTYTCSAGPLLRTAPAAAATGGPLPRPPLVRKLQATPASTGMRSGPPPSAKPSLQQQQQRRPGHSVSSSSGGGRGGLGASSLRETRSASERRAPSPSSRSASPMSSNSNGALRGSSVSRLETVPRSPKVPPPSARAHVRGSRPLNQQY